MTTSGQDLKVDQLGKVAVVSSLGDKAHRTYIGVTIFTTVKAKDDVSGWAVDQRVVDRIRSGFPQFERVVLRTGKERSLWGPFGLDSWPSEEVRSLGYDHYLLILPDQEPYRGFMPPGYGVLQGNAATFGGSAPCVYALFDMLLVDARSGKVSASAGSFDRWNGYPCAGATQVRKTFAEYTERELRQYRDEVYFQLDRGTDYALQQLNLH